ncbi:UNVERIFIED_CONTAM: hypothetical protein FKN15_005641 [Acipenser sinensis]
MYRASYILTRSTTKALKTNYVNLALEHKLIQVLSIATSLLMTCVNLVIMCSLSQHKPQPITGLLALQALALRAACADPIIATLTDKTVLQHLKQQLHHEKEHITNTEAMAGLAFQCLTDSAELYDARLNEHVQHALGAVKAELVKAQDEKGLIGNVFSTPLAVQTPWCLKDSAELYDARLNEHVQHALGAVKAELVKAQDEKGLIGNVFSTPLAVQALLAMNSAAAQCSTAVETLVTEMSLGTFHNPMAISQLLPVLHQKTYLDISKMDCTGEDDSLMLEPRPPAGDLPPEKVMVRVVVESSEAGPAIYTGRVRVPKGSSLHDALKEMQRQKPQEFTFETVDSLWGPYLTTVLGVMTQQANQTYWQLIKSPDTLLIEGIADYKIEHGDMFILRKSKW